MKSILVLSFLLLVVSYGFGQSHRRIPKILTLSKIDSIDWESQGMHHSTHLLLYQDSTFAFYSVYEVGYILSLGSYSKNQNHITLNWNPKKTVEAISDTNIYYRYFKHSTPSPFKMRDVNFEMKNDSLFRTTH